jgi:outer membrane protein
MIKKQALFIGALLLLLTGFQELVAQQSASLTLSECIQIALENNSQLRNAKYQVDRAKTMVTSTTSGWLPSISSSFGSSRSRLKQAGRITEDGYRIEAIDQTNSSHYAQISMNQLVFDFGRTWFNIKQSIVAKDGMQHTMLSTRHQVIVNVKMAYYELLKAYRLQEVYQEAVKLAEDQVKRSQTMMDIGLASQAELFQAKVNLGSNQMNLINQQNLVEMARADLNNALGRNPSTQIEVIEDKSETTFPDYEFEQAVDTCLKNNEQIKSLELDVKVSLYDIRARYARFFPTISGRVSYSRDSDELGRVYSSDLDNDFRATVGIGLNLDIFSGFSNTADLQRAKIDYKIAQENLAETKRVLAANVKDYFIRLKAYRDILEINKQNIAAAQENLRLQQEKRRVGSGTELEVTQAQVELTDALRTLVRAEYDAKIAKSQLEATMGVIKE